MSIDIRKAGEFVSGATRVTGDGPAAVLLVDTLHRQVVYANAIAMQLAPGVDLPADADEWSRSAALLDANGDELSDTEHPLSLIAQSVPVSGMAVSAGRATGLAAHGELLWAVALPLDDAPQLENQALVVLLPIAERERAQSVSGMRRFNAELRERAVLATDVSFTMADANVDDMPLVWVNPAFTKTTGYEFDDVVGKNCRFLQGEGSDVAAQVSMRRAIDARQQVTVTLLNYRKDGTKFWNQVSLSPIFSSDGDVSHFVGIQTDVTDKVLADQERDRALAEAEEARALAEQAEKRVTLLAETTDKLAGVLDVDQALDRLTDILVPQLADWTLAVTTDNAGFVDRAVARHRDGRSQEMALYEQEMSGKTADSASMRRVLAGAPARSHGDRWADSERLDELNSRLGLRSAMTIPLPGRSRVDGAMVLMRDDRSAPYEQIDLAVATSMGNRAGLIIDNIKLYESQSRIADTLQRSLLPGLPKVEGVDIAARYISSEVESEVGGDFYEILPLPRGGIGLAIGDVVGHDVFAAAAMGHLRGLIQACAWEESFDSAANIVATNPALVLDRVDTLMQGLAVASLATALYARIEPVDEQHLNWRVRFSNAGHPPLLVRRPDGSIDVLDGFSGTLLGVNLARRETKTVALETGSTIVAYTDGLIERRGASLDDGVEALKAAIASAPERPEDMCDHILAVMSGAGDDDTALVVVKI